MKAKREVERLRPCWDGPDDSIHCTSAKREVERLRPCWDAPDDSIHCAQAKREVERLRPCWEAPDDSIRCPKEVVKREAEAEGEFLGPCWRQPDDSIRCPVSNRGADGKGYCFVDFEGVEQCVVSFLPFLSPYFYLPFLPSFPFEADIALPSNSDSGAAQSLETSYSSSLPFLSLSPCCFLLLLLTNPIKTPEQNQERTPRRLPRRRGPPPRLRLLLRRLRVLPDRTPRLQDRRHHPYEHDEHDDEALPRARHARPARRLLQHLRRGRLSQAHQARRR